MAYSQENFFYVHKDLLAIILFGSLLCFLVFWFWLLPQQQALMQLQSKRIQYLQSKKIGSEYSLEKEKILAKYAVYQKENHSVSALMTALTADAQENHLIVKRLAPQETSSAQVKIIFHANTRFSGVVHFIKALHALPFALSIESLELESENKSLQLNMVFLYEN